MPVHVEQLSFWNEEEPKSPVGQSPVRTKMQEEMFIFHSPTKLWFYDGGREIVCDGQPGYYERFYGPNATERDLHGVWSCQFIGTHAYYPEECPVCHPETPYAIEMRRKLSW